MNIVCLMTIVLKIYLKFELKKIKKTLKLYLIYKSQLCFFIIINNIITLVV